MATTRPERLHFTENDEADELLAREPLALLIGFVLDQQVPVQKAFSSPLVLRSRLGGLEAHEIAQMDPAEVERVFRERPALHRFPGSMAARTQELCATLADDYDGRSGAHLGRRTRRRRAGAHGCSRCRESAP